MRKFFVFSSFAFIAIALSGCSLLPATPAVPQTPITTPGGNTSETPQSATPETPAVTPPSAVTPVKSTPAKADVNISNFSFNPATITINSGMTVVWTNNDSAPHAIASDNGSFSSNPLSNGQTFTNTFTTPGTYTYHCSIHPSMQGTIIVK